MSLVERIDLAVEELDFRDGGFYWYDRRKDREVIENLLCQAEMGGLRPSLYRQLEQLADKLEDEAYGQG